MNFKKKGRNKDLEKKDEIWFEERTDVSNPTVSWLSG